MKNVFVDFEMATFGKEYAEQRRIWHQEIIEIGAVMLDESMTEVSSFKKYVKPEFARHISNKIYHLTGIDDYFLNGCNGFQEEMEAFAEWCLSSGDDVTVYAWSESDLKQIQKEHELKGLIPSEKLSKIIASWKDLQAEYDEAVHAPRATALHKALASIGVDFSGKMHDALDDSRNTAKIYVELSNPEEFQKTVSYIHEYQETQNCCVTLGDLFDFSKLNLDFSESA